MKYGMQTHIFQLWNMMYNGPESCKYVTQCMLDGPNTETSEVRYTIGTQSNARMEKPTLNRP